MRANCPHRWLLLCPASPRLTAFRLPRGNPLGRKGRRGQGITDATAADNLGQCSHAPVCASMTSNTQLGARVSHAWSKSAPPRRFRGTRRPRFDGLVGVVATASPGGSAVSSRRLKATCLESQSRGSATLGPGTHPFCLDGSRRPERRATRIRRPKSAPSPRSVSRIFRALTVRRRLGSRLRRGSARRRPVS